MKLSILSIAALVYSSCCAASPETQQQTKRNTGTCSIGIGRWHGRVYWDVTIYNVAQPFRQVPDNVIATLKNAHMDKGDSITVTGPIPITITNIDNVPVFDYDVEALNQSWSDPSIGNTKVELNFSVQGGGNWTTETGSCAPGSVVWSAGIESWSCDFPCNVAA